ncbi:hypothetical protein CEW46_21415 [Bacillus cereus]|nr:hypothetical protein CEW46_21415 [Bacillus cereus]
MQDKYQFNSFYLPIAQYLKSRDQRFRDRVADHLTYYLREHYDYEEYRVQLLEIDDDDNDVLIQLDSHLEYKSRSVFEQRIMLEVVDFIKTQLSVDF